MAEELQDPKHTCRIFIQNDRFWFSDASAEELIDQLVIVGGKGTAHAERFRDGCGESVMPACVLVVESLEEERSLCTWLFRHDVIDGWRVLRFLTTLLFDDAELVLNRIRQRHQKKRGVGVRMLRGAAQAATIAALAPAAAVRVANLLRATPISGDVRQYYMHATVSKEFLKRLSKEHRLGGVTTALTLCIASAYFAADPSRKRANVGTNILFDPDKTQGNHVCVKMASLRRGDSMRTMARSMSSKSQQVADLLVGNATRMFVKGQLSKRIEDFLHRRHDSMDFLVSNLPAFDQTSPLSPGLQTVREFVEWAPSIIYVIGVDDNLFCDFYWGVRPTFNDAVFLQTFGELTQAKGMHTTLPDCY